MSPKRVRFEARLFRSESVRFEACSGFHAAADQPICACGWLEDEHAVPVAPTPLTSIRRLRPRAVRMPERRAS
jgi:hypothetical protein